jgi:predicted PurR-regulated permease PerM
MARAQQKIDPADEPLLLAGAEASQETIDELHDEAQREARVSDEKEFGRLGPRFDHSSPFFIGFTPTVGVICALTLAYLVLAAGQILILLGLAFFLAVGLDPAVRWLYKRGLPRWLAVMLVLLVVIGTLVAFFATAIPVIVTQATHLANALPHYLRSLQSRSSELGHFNRQYHIVARLQKILKGGSVLSFGSVLGVGEAVLGFVTSVVVVAIVSVYLLLDLPRVKRGIYTLVPKSRRARVVLIGEAIFDRVGGYVLGNLLTSGIAGVLTWAWAAIFGIPYALLLGLLVAILDLIPIIGSTIGGVIVSLIALSVSLPIAIATAAFYITYRFLEDYLLTPRIMVRTVAVPAGLVTVVATVVGAAILGIMGAVVAIPAAAAVKLLLEEIAKPRLDES